MIDVDAYESELAEEERDLEAIAAAEAADPEVVALQLKIGGAVPGKVPRQLTGPTRNYEGRRTPPMGCTNARF